MIPSRDRMRREERLDEIIRAVDEREHKPEEKVIRARDEAILEAWKSYRTQIDDARRARDLLDFISLTLPYLAENLEDSILDILHKTSPPRHTVHVRTTKDGDTALFVKFASKEAVESSMSSDVYETFVKRATDEFYIGLMLELSPYLGDVMRELVAANVVPEKFDQMIPPPDFGLMPEREKKDAKAKPS